MGLSEAQKRGTLTLPFIPFISFQLPDWQAYRYITQLLLLRYYPHTHFTPEDTHTPSHTLLHWYSVYLAYNIQTLYSIQPLLLYDHGGVGSVDAAETHPQPLEQPGR